MSDITKEKQFEGVSGWWNSEQIVKWDKEYDYEQYDKHTVRCLQRRQDKTLKFLKDLNLPKGAKVLELGYGAGQTALIIGKLGYEVYGVDISEKLQHIAEARCKSEDPDGQYFLTVGNIETGMEYEDEMFDVVLNNGTLQYLYDDVGALKEAYRVLKPGGALILGQRTGYELSQFTSFREILFVFAHAVLREKYELFHSFKALLCDTKLGVIFKRWEKAKWMNSALMLKEHDDWTYHLKKKYYTNRRLKLAAKKAGFQPSNIAGAYYCWSGKPKYHDFNMKLDNFLEKFSQKPLLGWVYNFARVTVLLSRKVKAKG